MALQLLDRVLQTGTANTTVSFTLSGSVTGYQGFSALTNGNTTYYAATDTSGNWETGLGTYSSTGPTLTRTTVYQSSNSNTAVTFSGTVTVWVDYPSSTSIVASNNSTQSSTQVLTSNGVGVAPSWQTISAGATVTPTTSSTTYYIVGSSTTSGTQTIASISTSISYNASTNVVTATQFSASSDERLKQDIKTITDALTKVETLRGVSYLRNGKPEIGVIAQEVERVVPEVVHVDQTEYGYKSVSYDNLVGLLIEAVKELSAEVKELKAKVSED